MTRTEKLRENIEKIEWEKVTFPKWAVPTAISSISHVQHRKKMQAFKQKFCILCSAAKSIAMEFVTDEKFVSLWNACKWFNVVWFTVSDVGFHSGCLLSSFFHPVSIYRCLRKHSDKKAGIQHPVLLDLIKLQAACCTLHVKLIEM